MSNPNKDVVDFTNLIKDKFAMRKDIAPVEDSSTASRAYSAGDLFYYGNLLQRATQDIAQGAGFAAGVNFENADPLGTQFGNLSNNLYTNGSKNIFWHDINSWMRDNEITGYGNFTGNTWERGGISITLNDDGTFTVYSSSQTGTPHYTCIYSSTNDDIGLVNGETYILSGAGGRNTDEIINFLIDGVANVLYNNQTYEFVYDKTKTYEIRFILRDGTPNHDFTYKPMICLKSDYELDPTYEPPAPTNRALEVNKVGMDLLGEVGAYNIFDFRMLYSNNITVVVNDDGSSIRAYNSTAGTWKNTFANVEVKPNTEYRVVADGVFSTGSMQIAVATTDDSQTLGGSAAYTTDTHIDFTFNSGNNSKVRFKLFVTGNSSVTGDITYNNVMITPVLTSNIKWAPYAKTNRELTEDVADIAYVWLTNYGSSQYTLTEGAMWQTKGVTFLYVAVTCNTVSPIENGNHIQIATIPSKFKKPQFNIYPTICNYRDGSSHIGAQLQVLPSGTIAIRGGEAGARYSGLFSY